MIVIKRKYIRIAERLAIVIAVIIITAVIVKASDRGLNKSQDNITENNGCPDGMVFVPAAGGGFCLDKYEASAGGECPNSNPENQADSLANVNFSGCLPASVKGAVPWRNISQNQAAIVCAKAGKRLPTNKEWQQAALGTPDISEGWKENDCQADNNWESQPGLTGSAASCVSSAGAYDMIGNVWEWIDGTISEGMYKDKLLPDGGYIAGVDDEAWPSATKSDLPDINYYNDYFWIKKTGTRGIARGGYWDNRSDAGQYAVYAVSEPSFAGVGVGFRCAR